MKALMAAWLALPILTACATVDTVQPAVRTNLIEANYEAVDKLVAGLSAAGGPAVAAEQPILVATLVNVDSLNESSRLGRLFSEQIAARLTKLGFKVKELKLRDNLFMKQNEGELLLSREVSEVSKAHNARAVVVGTYASSGSMLYLNLKFVHPAGNIVLSAHDYAMPIDSNLNDLLGKRKTGYY